jgi:transmembrane sensor
MSDFMKRETSDDDAIADAAALWLAEREEGFSPEQARAFAQWCAADPRHRVALARMEETAARLQQLPQVRERLNEETGVPVAPAEPVRRRSRWPQVAALAAGLAIAGLGGWQGYRSLAPESARYATSAGGYEHVGLEDGSTLELNANSEARVRFTRGERHVTLVRGEAHFSVARDPARPFIVTAGKVQVRAVGTAFNVRLAAAEVAVLVTEGKVQVGPLSARTAAGGGPAAAAAPALLAASERTVIPADAGPRAEPPRVERVSTDRIRDALAWQERKLVFADTPLRDVVAQFNRRNLVQLTIGDADLAGRPVGGTFAADNVGAFVRLFEESGDIVVERRSEREIVLRRAR